MGEEETLEHQSSIAAPLIFIIIIAFQLSSRWLLHLKKRGFKSAVEIQLCEEIKQLIKEANSLSQPSTFAQATKLRRLAVAKEKELASYQELHNKEMKLSYDFYLKVLFISKVVVYLLMICWFWSSPVATISQQLVQPFGKVLSWRAGGITNKNVKVGIIPWLVLSTRVSKFICRAIK